ncbi:MAG: 8-oxo-dGTP diphosphatase [Clostridiales bacterium]|nr:8-oxo-dGTP diphosphatase [Candidatus Apopatousia equi]
MEELRTVNTTLVLLRKENKILLGQKKRGFAKGTFNGIGGKQDQGETIDQAMIRECQEEIGATPTKYELRGKILFDVWYKGEHVNMPLYIYNCTEFTGDIIETEEMIPTWFDLDKIPFDKMLQDDLLWYEYFLADKKFVGKVKFDPNMNMLSHEFNEVETL